VIQDRQVMALFQEYTKSKNIKLCSLKVGMNRKTAAKYLNSSKLPSELKKERNWRTHPDKLIKIWDLAESFLQNDPDIEARALFEHLLEEHSDKLEENQLRSFQRQVKQWRIQNGKEKEIYFDQISIPGKMAQVDWVDLNLLNITINGVHYKHKLIHFVLNYSNVESATICKSESIISIKNGIRDFLYRVALKAPQILQIDNSSAATHRPQMEKSTRVFNEDYLEILKYYGVKPQKNNIRKPNENGVVESQNGHLKRKIIQALKIRGSKEFKGFEEYKKFIEIIVDKANKRRETRFQEEFSFMNRIPTVPLPDYQELYITIKNRSIAFIKGKTYSVPSRLIGSRLKAKIYESKIELCSGNKVVHSLNKIAGSRGVNIDYRHIINSLLRKPAAFSSYKYKEELFPTDNFKKAYEQLVEKSGYENRTVNLEYLRILKLAADNIEEDVDVALGLILSSKVIKLTIDTVSDLILDKTKHQIDPMALTPSLSSYDDLFLTKKEKQNEDSYA
jgi:hypothetical protein